MPRPVRSCAWYLTALGRTVRSRREDAGVTAKDRTERTATLLMARLDSLARTANQLPHAETERLLELASVATTRAVALELLDADRAARIWHDAHVQHPELPNVAVQLRHPVAA
jgi:hypothetical protein